MDIQQLTRKLRALQFGTHETEMTQPAAVEANKPKEQVESVNLAFDHCHRVTVFYYRNILGSRATQDAT